MLLSITEFRATGFNRFKYHGLQTDAEEVSICINDLNDAGVKDDIYIPSYVKTNSFAIFSIIYPHSITEEQNKCNFRPGKSLKISPNCIFMEQISQKICVNIFANKPIYSFPILKS